MATSASFPSLRTLILVAALLSGCVLPGPSLVGSDRGTVQASFGAPAEKYPLSGGGERWMYPRGGLQQEVQAVDFDAAGRVVSVRQVRAAEHFARVRIDVDTEADILREFGRPRTKQPYRLVNLVGWMYPYVEAGFLNSEMVIYFDPQGIVRRMENGPDPRFLGGGDQRH